jgi:3-hydroxyisobutyrate dehydrogenase-like beta-hydroxyacid dehydrogenase
MSKVGILNPGLMGISIAASIQSAGHDVYWVSTGRSTESRSRAEDNNLNEVETLSDLCNICEIIVCVCPPHGAEDLANEVIKAGFDGLYCDGNAISPQKAQRIGEALSTAGIDFVDGSIVGPPAWKADTTRLYLSGKSANQIAELFVGSVTDAVVIGDEVGRASALKMVFAAQTKGFTALLCAVQATAEKLGVRGDLDNEWARRDSNAVTQREQQVRGVTAKAWRFTGEMKEMVDTFEGAGLPNGFFVGALEVYERISHFKGADELPELSDVLSALMKSE